MYLQKDKSIFKVDELPVERFAEALGLPGMPKIKFLSKEMAKKKKNASRAVADPGPSSAIRDDVEESEFDASGTSDEEGSDEENSDEEGSDEEEEGSPKAAAESVAQQQVCLSLSLTVAEV